MNRPVIGVTADVMAPQQNGDRRREAMFNLPQRYCRAIEKAGGTPIILPTTVSAAARRQYLERVEGLLVSGGNFDIHPKYYGEKPLKALGEIKEERTDFELELTSRALNKGMPILGICGGAQAINVCLGGSLYQDIATQLPNADEHEQGARKDSGGHHVRVHRGTRLREIVNRDVLEVNTTHHQAIKALGKQLVVNATAEDGLIEGIESSHHSFVLGVQWHPEVLSPTRRIHHKIFTAFISSCRRFAAG